MVQQVTSRTITQRPNPLLIALLRFLGPLIGLLASLCIAYFLLAHMWKWISPFLWIVFLFLLLGSAFQAMNGRMQVGDAISWAFGTLFRLTSACVTFISRTLNQWFQTMANQITANPQNRQLTVWDIVCAGENLDVFSIQVTGDIISGGVPATGHRVRVEGVPASPRRLWNLTTNAEVTWRRPRTLGF